jgi:hypothetical protein
MVCLGNMCVDTLHKGDNKDDDDDDDNNNNNNNNNNIIIIIILLMHIFIQHTRFSIVYSSRLS